MLLPGTYGTSLLRNHALRGVFEEMEKSHFPEEAVKGIKDTVDCNIYFFGDKVSQPTMYIVLGVTVILLISLYVFLNMNKEKKSKL